MHTGAHGHRKCGGNATTERMRAHKRDEVGETCNDSGANG